jgi:UDP-hydrolysing UDP-N-acetyl-D-glucosamine 2-epimerase
MRLLSAAEMEKRIQSLPRACRVEPDHALSLPRGNRKNKTGCALAGFFTRPFLLATFHPVTLEFERTEQQIEQFLAALDEVGMPVLFTAPNADTAGRSIAAAIGRYVAAHANSCMVENLGPGAYFSAMALAAAMAGNSSSGIIEAASFELPVVNVGTRQRGRTRAANVIDCGYSREEVVDAIRRAITPAFRASLKGLTNPYGDGLAAPRIMRELVSTPLGDRVIRKKFHGSGT